MCLDQSCYELVYKHRKIQKNKWKAEAEETDDLEFDDAEETETEKIDATGEVNEAIVKRPTIQDGVGRRGCCRR